MSTLVKNWSKTTKTDMYTLQTSLPYQLFSFAYNCC